MSEISQWSSVDNDNNQAVPTGAPEGWFAPEVNNWGRDKMGAIRRKWEDKEWFDFGDTPTFVNATRFDVNTDLTARYHVGRRLKFTDATTLYGTITNSVFTGPNTEVTVVLDSGSLSVSLTVVFLGSDAANPAISGTAISDDSIATAKLQDSSVTAVKLATDSVTNVKVADQAIDFTNQKDDTKRMNIGTTSGPADVYELETGFSISTPIQGMKISATAHASNTGAAVAQLQVFTDTGDTPTFVSTTQFNITGVDVTANYVVNDRIKITDSSTLFGTIFSSTFTGGNTEVVVTLDSGSITVAISAVATGAAIVGQAIKKKSANDIVGNDIEANDLIELEFDGTVWFLTAPFASLTAKEATGSSTTSVGTSYVTTATANLGSVSSGDRFTVSCQETNFTNINGMKIIKSAGTATIQFLDTKTELEELFSSKESPVLTGICKVTGTGTLTLAMQVRRSSGFTASASQIHAFGLV